MVVIGGSKRLLSLVPTTVLVVLLLGLWLLLGCDNKQTFRISLSRVIKRMNPFFNYFFCKNFKIINTESNTAHSQLILTQLITLCFTKFRFRRYPWVPLSLSMRCFIFSFFLVSQGFYRFFVSLNFVRIKSIIKISCNNSFDLIVWKWLQFKVNCKPHRRKDLTQKYEKWGQDKQKTWRCSCI